MSGTHFYLTLPSNASLDVFPDNKTTSYRVKLPQTIDLEGNWEVGLYSISYPNTWYTLQKGFDTHIYYADQSGLFLAAIVDYGYYTSIEDLTKAINASLLATGDVGDNILLTYNALTGKVTAQMKNGFQFGLVKPLSIMLGFGEKDVIIKKTTESPYVADLTTVSIIVTLSNPKSSETRALNYSKVFLPKESLVTLLPKRLPTFNTCRSERNPLRPWRSF